MKEAVLFFTANCPCSCDFCDTQDKHFNRFNGKTLSEFEWKSIIDKLVSEGLEIAVISGGEALLDRKKTFNLINHLHKKNVYVVLNTSGLFFKKNKIIEELKNNYPDLLVFSIDSIIPSQHDGSRGVNGLFDTVVDTIEELKNTGDYPIGIRFVITKENYKQIPELLLYFNKKGVDCIKFTHIENDRIGKFRLTLDDLKYFDKHIRNQALESLKLCTFSSNDKKEEAIKKIINLFNKNHVNYQDIADGIFSPSLVNDAYCGLLYKFCMVEANGDVLPCCESQHYYSPVCGNLLKENVTDILSSDIYSNLKNNRQHYCIYCTQPHNMQISFNHKANLVTRRWR